MNTKSDYPTSRASTNTRRIPVLTYHSIDESGSPISTPPDRFRRQMEYLQANGWQTLSVPQMLSGYTSGEWPVRSFGLAFDDAFENFATHAMPVLHQFGFSATVFAVAAWVGRTNAWPDQPDWVPRFPLLNWEALRQIAESGIEIGAHSLSHPHLIHLTAPEREREIVVSKFMIEDRIGQAVTVFAYPYGETNPASEKVVAGHYEAGFGTTLGSMTAANRITALRRIDAYYLTTTFFLQAIGTWRLEAYLGIRQMVRDLRRISRRGK